VQLRNVTTLDRGSFVAAVPPVKQQAHGNAIGRCEPQQRYTLTCTCRLRHQQQVCSWENNIHAMAGPASSAAALLR
jgi:hypothetical protein